MPGGAGIGHLLFLCLSQQSMWKVVRMGLSVAHHEEPTLRRHYEQAIRERAYTIWEEEGCPHGNDLDHWLRAEAEIMPVHIDNFDHFHGQTVSDPFDGLNPATSIHIDGKTFVPNDPPGVGPRLLPNMAHYEGVLLSVHFIEDERNKVEGSAVMVAPGIAFMATHVLESYIPGVMPSTAHMLCIGYAPSGPRIWYVRYYHKVEKSDVTILSLEYASPFPADGSFAQAMLTTRLPGIGEQVMIVGLRASDQHVPADQSMSFSIKGEHIEYGANVLVAVGEVSEHYLTGRGSMPPGPAIEVACSTPGGLSGGPAFDKNGRLIGILSNSYDYPDGGVFARRC
jgi:hypothetical protein